MAYVSDVSVIKEGVDYYIGSYKAARKITTAVKDVMGGVVQESPRLVGRDKSTRKGFVQNMDIHKTARFPKR